MYKEEEMIDNDEPQVLRSATYGGDGSDGYGEVNVVISVTDNVFLHDWIDAIGNVLLWSEEHCQQTYDEYVFVLKHSPNTNGWRESDDGDFIIERERFTQLMQEVEERWNRLPRTYHEKVASATKLDEAFDSKGYIELDDLDD